MQQNKVLFDSYTFVATVLFLAMLVAGCSSSSNSGDNGSDPSLANISLPPGFTITVYADEVPNARSLARGDNGTIFVGNRSGGNVYAVLDDDDDQLADRVLTIANGLNMPNGVAFREGALYVAEVNKVWRYDNIEANLENPGEPVLISDNFPSDTHHGWKFIRFGPDGKLYVPVGAPCNICDNSNVDERYASITRMNPDGSDHEVFAHGVRNTVGFDWHPQSNDLWFTDNGRDHLGDDSPPDELNRAPSADMHFGYPYCHGGTIADPEFNSRSCSDFTAPAMPLGPHVAALGMRFYTGSMFPESYREQIFIAEHGSWNRSTPIGYRITLVRHNGTDAQSYNVFADGWLDGEEVSGRPVDVLVMPDGALLVSDDFAHKIYRISYHGE